jgi:23S rRNA (pseudouridine1915-N3)-methyltransferase
MKLQIVAVGLKLPDWAQTACDEYLKRFTPEFRVEVKTVRAEVRSGKPVSALLQAERERIESAVSGALDCPRQPWPRGCWSGNRTAPMWPG